MSPADLHFLESHEWVGRDGEVAVVGISEFAVHQLTDLVYVDLPKAGGHGDARRDLRRGGEREGGL